MIKNLPATWETWVRSLGWEDPLGKGMATLSSIPVQRSPWMKEPGQLQSTESQRVRKRLSLSKTEEKPTKTPKQPHTHTVTPGLLQLLLLLNLLPKFQSYQITEINCERQSLLAQLLCMLHLQDVLFFLLPSIISSQSLLFLVNFNFVSKFTIIFPLEKNFLLIPSLRIQIK